MSVTQSDRHIKTSRGGARHNLTSALGVEFEVIRASMSLEARSVAIQRSTSLENTTTVLLTTFNCGALGLNMHANCSRIVLLEGSQKYNSVLPDDRPDRPTGADRAPESLDPVPGSHYPAVHGVQQRPKDPSTDRCTVPPLASEPGKLLDLKPLEKSIRDDTEMPDADQEWSKGDGLRGRK
jgi:hypothetical protein